MGMGTTLEEWLRRQSGEPAPERLVFAVTQGFKSSDLFNPEILAV